MVYASSLVVFACSLSAFASPLNKRTVAEVEADIDSISAQLAIHKDAMALASAIKQGTTDVQRTRAVSEADANTILVAVQGFKPNIIDTLHAIVTKKPGFDGFPLGSVSPLVKQDLDGLNTQTTAFENALIAAAPPDLKASATAIKTAVDAAFASAIAAYS